MQKPLKTDLYFNELLKVNILVTITQVRKQNLCLTPQSLSLSLSQYQSLPPQ